MVYCMSDVHGDLEKFHSMLQLIRFSAKDTLFVIGDVIDRGPDGIEIIEEIMNSGNIIMLLGNHEKMCPDTLGSKPIAGSRGLWRDNGGSATYRQLIYLCDSEERARIIGFMEKLPNHADIEVGGRKFHLVHGYPSSTPYERVWGHPESTAKAPIEGVTTIVGHTPTCFMTGRNDLPMDIWHGEGLIDIDCGCGMSARIGRLGCLRLDDMAEFYI